ncbi:MAG: HEAT repeat domain-containing protein [Hyphomicrobiales bacterium]|nr:HEAT repeat domain-containing protein [Hyphomicrobiales bacterium]
MERRLTTILAADVVGYSRLMGEDEAGTLATLKAHRAELIDPKAAQYGGRTIKLMGDGILMEFASVVDAVGFAVDVQNAMRERTSDVPKSRQVLYRIGINIGDVIAEDNDIYGDGVNVAARLEGLADTGGVCIGRNVRDQIRDKLDLNLEDLGEVEVKNIARPVRAFQIVMDEKASALSTSIVQVEVQPKRTSRAGLLAVLGLGVLAMGGAILWWQPWSPKFEAARMESMALPLPDKPSIAVLPFNNMSQDASQEHFVDGMTEDLITDLSKISDLFVIARNSTFVYKNTPVKIKKVAEDLGVRYVLEGSVRRVGNQLRVNAQLLDATTGGHVWAERFDGKATDIFSVQDEFVFKIVKALELKLSEREKNQIEQSDTDKIEAREAFQRGWELYSRFNAQDNAKAVGHFEKAVELDPDYGRAYGALALVYSRAVFFRWYRALGLTGGEIYNSKISLNLNKARQHPTALVHVVAAMRYLFYWDQSVAEGTNRGTDDARIEAGTAIALQPNEPEAHIAMAWALIASGKPEEGLNFVQAAMRLNPNHPSHYVFFSGAAHFAKGDLKQAASILRQGMERDPRAIELAPLAASIYAQLGHRQEAHEAVVKWRPGASQSILQKTAYGYEFPIRWVDRWLRTRLLDGLQLASLPLEVTVSSLKAEFEQSSPSEQWRIVQALGWFGPAAADAVPELIEALGNEHKGVRKEAAIALGKIGPGAKAAVPALTAITDKPLIGFHARDAITRINGK